MLLKRLGLRAGRGFASFPEQRYLSSASKIFLITIFRYFGVYLDKLLEDAAKKKSVYKALQSLRPTILPLFQNAETDLFSKDAEIKRLTAELTVVEQRYHYLLSDCISSFL